MTSFRPGASATRGFFADPTFAKSRNAGAAHVRTIGTRRHDAWTDQGYCKRFCGGFLWRIYSSAP